MEDHIIVTARMSLHKTSVNPEGILTSSTIYTSTSNTTERGDEPGTEKEMLYTNSTQVKRPSSCKASKGSNKMVREAVFHNHLTL